MLLSAWGSAPAVNARGLWVKRGPSLFPTSSPPGHGKTPCPSGRGSAEVGLTGLEPEHECGSIFRLTRKLVSIMGG